MRIGPTSVSCYPSGQQLLNPKKIRNVVMGDPMTLKGTYYLICNFGQYILPHCPSECYKPMLTFGGRMQIHTILSDKTGTLTQNKMELFKVGCMRIGFPFPACTGVLIQRR